MEYGKVAGVEKKISKFVLGTMILDTENLSKSFELLDSAVSLGINTFDTAHVYNSGKSERTLGKWIEARKNRDKIVIISKGVHPNIDRKRVTPFDISSDLYDSLSRLNNVK